VILLRPLRRFPRTAKTVAVLAVAIALVVLGTNAYVLLSTRGEATASVKDVPHAQTAIVLGALVNRDGTMSSMLADRVKQASRLWRAGKVDRVLVSGDHGKWRYDEPDTMRKALIRDGVPPRDIFTDHAGFDTWATMVRARKVFRVRSATVITQGFHMPRALYLANAAGLRAHGLTSDLHGYGIQGKKSDVREVIARMKAASQGVLQTGVLLGPRLPITGDGRKSWGPAPPRGTPPAGAPSH
jgi:SanA protein